MERIERSTQKVFAGESGTESIAVFGSMKTGNPIYTDNIEDLQSSDYEQGWEEGIVANEAPFLEEMNGVQYVLSKQIAYGFQEGMAEYDAGTTYYIGSWCKGIDETGRRAIYESLTDNNLGNPLTDSSKWEKVDLGGGGGSSLPLFTPMVFDRVLTGTEAVGWALQGSLVSSVYSSAVNDVKQAYSNGVQTTYRGISCKRAADGRYIADISQKSAVDELFSTTGVADFYILDETNNEFYLPRSKWFNQFTLDTDLVNNFNEAGLPNITANSGLRFRSNEGTPTGAFTSFGYTTINAGGSSPVRFDGLNFDASLSNPIYGKSDSVQPPSSNKLLYYKVGDTIVNESEIDIAQVLNELENKADIDASNFSSAGMANITGFCIPDYTAGVSVPVTAAFTPEANGLLVIGAVTKTQLAQIIVYLGTDPGTRTNIMGFTQDPQSSFGSTLGAPVKKGAVYSFNTQNTANCTATFYPYIGETNA